MGDRGATGGAWGARDDASWWPGSAGDLQNQQQLNEDIVRSTASATQQLFTYKMTGGFSNNTSDNSTANYDYRMLPNSNNREESQQQWWYTSGSVESHPQASSPTPQSQPSPDSEQGEQGTRQNQTLQQQQEQNQAIQQQNQLQQLQQQQQQNLQQVLQQHQNHLQQSLQQEQQNQHQTLQQMLQQHQQQQSLQQTLQVSQAQAQALAQAALQQQVAQSLQQQQKSLHEQIQAVQQQQIQAALQRQSATLQELQQQSQQQQQQRQQQQHLGSVPRARMPRARADNKPRGRMTAYAFFVQNCREEHKQTNPDENVVFSAFSKKCAERWNSMSEKEKVRFHELAEQDKKRFDLEMQSYVPPKDVKVRGRKRQQHKDPNAPKRSLSAFFLFCNDERGKVKASNPEFVMGDIAKELGRRWAAAGPDVKAKYEALSDQDKARYDREMTAYKKGPLALLQLQQQQMPSKPELEEDLAVYETEDYN